MANEAMTEREMDILIAERIMQWEWWRSSSSGCRCLFAPGAIPRCKDEWFKERADGTEPLVCDWDSVRIPRYSTDIAAAMLVLEKLRERTGVVISDYGVGKSGWSVTFVDLNGPDVDGETLPLAICRAALALLAAQMEAGNQQGVSDGNA